MQPHDIMFARWHLQTPTLCTDSSRPSDQWHKTCLECSFT